MSTANYKCANKSCGALFIARTADRARGWARFCSKACKATQQTRRTGYAGPNLMRLAEAGAQEDYPTFDNAHQFDNTEPVQDNPL